MRIFMVESCMLFFFVLFCCFFGISLNANKSPASGYNITCLSLQVVNKF